MQRPDPAPCRELFFSTIRPQDDMPIKPDYLHNPALRLLLFGGKGGVGKTTLSVASALFLAEVRPSSTILIVSTDPAHSLSDSLGCDISDAVTSVPMEGGGANLFARQLSSDTLAARFRQKHGETMQTIAERGTYFDREDITGFFSLSMPGLDEVMGMLEVADLVAGKAWDVLILDTAPTGHTLRLLALPEQMSAWVRVMDLMLHKHRYMATVFSGKRYVKDRCDRFLDTLGREVTAVGKLLRDPRLTRFVPVMNPEIMSFRETAGLVESLEGAGVPLREILVNRVIDDEGCELCRGEHRRQRGLWGQINERFARYETVSVVRDKGGMRGIGALGALGRRLGQGGDAPTPVVNPQKGEGLTPPLVHGSGTEGPQAAELFDALESRVSSGLEMIVVGGKGGVGKTTVAVSVSLELSRRLKDRRVLLVSTDPAHSLSDALNLPVGDRITPVTERLSAYEMDADRLFEAFKADSREEIRALFDRFAGKGMDIAFDREVMTELLALAPSGLDEIMALDAVMDVREQRDCDVLVLDASPTGHLLRFLETPALVRQWLKAYFTVLMKYKGGMRLTKTVEKVIALSRNVRRIQQQLTDTGKTTLVAVTLPEAMVQAETERLLAYVKGAGISCGHLVVNRVMPESVCPSCTAIRRREQSCLAVCRTRFPDVMVTEIPWIQGDVGHQPGGS